MATLFNLLPSPVKDWAVAVVGKKATPWEEPSYLVRTFSVATTFVQAPPFFSY